MTREEAIKEIKDIVDNWQEDYAEEVIMAIEEIQALNMAIKALEQEPCEDAISREELLKAIDTWDRFGVDDTNSLFRLDNLSLPHYVPYIHYDDVIKCIKGMPSVNPQEPKTGHWEWVQYDYNPKLGNWHCSECRSVVVECVSKEEKGGIPLYKYCPQCGAKMESEDEE